MLRTDWEDPPSASDRAMLLVYEPARERELRAALDHLATALSAAGIPHACVDLSKLPFQVMADRDLLPQACELDAMRPSAFRSDLSRRLEEAVLSLMAAQAEQLGPGVVVLTRTSALYPWVSFASVLKRIPAGTRTRFLVPFPGTETGSSLHFLGRRNGFDYLARRV